MIIQLCEGLGCCRLLALVEELLFKLGAMTRAEYFDGSMIKGVEESPRNLGASWYYGAVKRKGN